MSKLKPFLFAAPFVLVTSLSGQALAHEDHAQEDHEDSIRVTVVIDGKEHDISIDEDGVEVDGHRIEDIEVTVEIDGDISVVIDEVLDEVEAVLAEVEEAIDEVRDEVHEETGAR